MMITPATLSTNRGDNSTDLGRQRNVQPSVEHSPTYNVDLSDLERQLRQDKRELQKEIDQLKRDLSQR